MMKVLPQQLRLYAVTDSRRLRGRTLLDTVAAALDGGATFVQLREKELSPAALLEEARALAKLCHARHVPFVVDDNVEVALAAGADGVHVGQSDMAARRARALLGPDKILGVSAHNAAEALAAQAVAIGGIEESNILQLQGRGLAGVAVVSAIFAAQDPEAASRRLYELSGQL